MAQFRTTADILDEVLQKAGEPTNGNSPFESLALTYANKMNHAIIGGGNIFNLNVDESWTWARSRYPIVLELQPAIEGTAAFVSAASTLAFGSAPTTSGEGWFIQAKGKSTIYKVTQHTASTTAAHMDSSFVDASGSYAYRMFKLDYEIVQPYVYIDNFNDRLNFQETAATVLTASLTHGTYTPSAYISHVAAQMQTASISTATYGASYDSVLRTYNLTGSVTYSMLGSTGLDYKRTALPTMGFDLLNHTAAKSYTSAYQINRVSRMVEPFKVFTAGSRQPYVYSTDPVRMQKEYPLHLMRECVPDRFARIMEDKDGAIWVRFNAYPKSLTKLHLDWVPQPIDLQDNTVSSVLLPRQDVDTLIHGAAAFILFDKEDSKWEAMLNLCKAGLESMQMKHRQMYQKTGEYFGQIVPREDYVGIKPSKLGYGYTSGEG